MFLDAISVELKSRDDKIATVQNEFKEFETVINDMKVEKAQEYKNFEHELDEQKQHSHQNNLGFSSMFWKHPR